MLRSSSSSKLDVARGRVRTLIDGLDLSVGPGTIHAIVGPNGAGKSSPRRRDPRQRSLRRRDRPALSALERIVLRAPEPRDRSHAAADGARARGPRTPATPDVLRRRAPRARRGRAHPRSSVGLSHLADRRLGALSGGELRRVLLANALDPVPELILLDEPAAGLDQSSVRGLERPSSSLRDESGDTTVLLVSHDIQQVEPPRRSGHRRRPRRRREGSVAEVLGDRPSSPSSLTLPPRARRGGTDVDRALCLARRAGSRRPPDPRAFQYAFVVRGMLCRSSSPRLLGGMSHLVVTRRLAFFSTALGQASLTG
jgi:zinc transport system ATP-binding protein